MRFGTFVFSLSSDPTQDHQVIAQTLREVELAEAIGMDAVWLTEHHFDGAVAYADPVVFAAAVAMRTHRVRIGFAVVEMALHHPVRLAVQTALVDHLSRGRLIVGTGRGSAYNAHEARLSKVAKGLEGSYRDEWQAKSREWAAVEAKMVP